MYIERHDKKDSLYRRLQDESITLLQELCGKVWTDFNLHDPGVTTLKILNYALYELAYKLGFPLEDYLCRGEPETSAWEDYGLVARREAERGWPVTTRDYERLILERVPGLAACRVQLRGGKYDFTITAAPGTAGKGIMESVARLYHAHRNLGETLGNVRFAGGGGGRVGAEGADCMDGGIGVAGGGNVDAIHSGAGVYGAAGGGYVDAIHIAAGADGGVGPFLDTGGSGSAGGGSERRTGGAGGFREGFAGNTGNTGNIGFSVGTDGDGYAEKVLTGTGGLHGPAESAADRICGDYGSVETGGNIGPAGNRESAGLGGNTGPAGFGENTGHAGKIDYAASDDTACFDDGLREPKEYIDGQPRNILAHRPVALDFPDCYGINANGIQPRASGPERIRTAQFRQYLTLFDMLSESVLAQAAAIPDIVSRHGPSVRHRWAEYPDDSGGELRDREALDGVQAVNCRTVRRLRQEWMRFLCALHGEDEGLFAPFTSGASPARELEKRFAVAVRLPRLLRLRAKGAELTDPAGRDVAGITALFMALEGAESRGEEPVSGVFAKYSIKMVRDSALVRRGKFIMDLEYIPGEESVQPVRLAASSGPAATPKEVTARMPVFGRGAVPESMLVYGPDSNFWSAVAEPGEQVRLLFRHRETGVRLDMGLYAAADEAARYAAGARRFLRELSLSSARLYIVEHILFEGVREIEGGRLTVVLPWWTRVGKRRPELGRFIAERLPAHLDSRFLWLHAEDLTRFEKLYYPWKAAVGSGARAEELSRQLHGFLRLKYATE